MLAEIDPFAHRTHGLISTYRDGCHCNQCKVVARDYARRYRAGKAHSRALSEPPLYSCRRCGVPFWTEIGLGVHQTVVHELW